MRAGSMPAPTSRSSSSTFSSTESEFASEFVPNTASPTFCDRSQRQCRTKRSGSGERSALNEVTTGESTPDMRSTSFTIASFGSFQWSDLPTERRGRLAHRVVILFRAMSQPANLRDVSAGNFRFLPGIPPFSSGVVAMSGFQVVHATLRAPIPWRDGFGLIDRHLRAESRPRAALCAIELRIAAPFSFEGFDTFNAGYRAVLTDWKILLDGENP